MAFDIFELLESEHRLVAKVLTVAHSCIPNMAQPGVAVQPVSTELIGFCGQFVSRYHQPREFELFRCLQRKGCASITAPMRDLLAEHGRLARLTGMMEAACWLNAADQPGTSTRVAGYLSDYIALTQEHMLKEDRFILTASSLVDSFDQAALAVAFEKFEQELPGTALCAHHAKWAQQWACGDTLPVRRADGSRIACLAPAAPPWSCATAHSVAEPL